MIGQTTRLPFYCARCGSLYDQPAKLVECLARHEENAERMRGVQRALDDFSDRVPA